MPPGGKSRKGEVRDGAFTLPRVFHVVNVAIFAGLGVSVVFSGKKLQPA